MPPTPLLPLEGGGEPACPVPCWVQGLPAGRGGVVGTGHMARKRCNGFIVVEILIAGLILTSSIAASMYLFRMGFEHLERANQSNVLSSKLTQATGLIRTLDFQKNSGEENLGDDVTLKWKSKLLGSSKPIIMGEGEVPTQSRYELLLYRVDFSLQYKGNIREYQINAFRYKTSYSPEEVPL